MLNKLKRFLSQVGVKLFITCLTVFAPFQFGTNHFITSAYVQAQSVAEIPQGWESYQSRPDILNVPAKALDKTDSNWEAIKAAHFSFVAELLVLYPEQTDIYFLARDSEHLYDVARLVTQGKADANRIHLLNVSRANMRDANLLPYLNEFGISVESLKAGKKVLFIDTGFAGTIPRVIAESFPSEVRAQFKTHLIVSSNPNHPSSRVFLIHLNPAANDQVPSAMHSSIVNYEHMARYTDRSSKYVWAGQQYHPISPIVGNSDGSVSKSISLRYMQDFKAEWEKPDIKSKFEDQKKQFEKVKGLLLQGGDVAKAEIKSEMTAGHDPVARRIILAQIMDTFSTQQNAEYKLGFSEFELGIKPTNSKQVANNESKKNVLIKKYPEWAPILENPDDTIPKLFVEKNWQMIGNLVDAHVDFEIEKLLMKSLFDAPATGIKKDLQINFITGADQKSLEHLTAVYFKSLPINEVKDLIEHVINQGIASVWSDIVVSVLSQPHMTGFDEVVKKLILTGGNQVQNYLAKHFFSKPHSKDMHEALKLLIENGNSEILNLVAKEVYSKIYHQDKIDPLKILIDRGDALTMHSLSFYGFSKPPLSARYDLIRLILEKSNFEGRFAIASSIGQYQPSKEMESTHAILRKAVNIPDNGQRKAFMDSEFMKLEHGSAKNIESNSKLKEISAKLLPGDRINVKDRIMTVLKKAGEGRRGVIFQVKADSGAVYALKTMKNNDPETLASLAGESGKAKQWQELKIPHSKVLVQEKEYVLKTWIEGIRGDEVIEKLAAGDLSMKPAAESLLKLVRHIRSQGAYVGDFRPPNLILVGKAWIIVDSGSIQQGMSLEEAQAKWESADARGVKFERRWQLPVPPAVSPAVMKCMMLFPGVG